MYIAQELRSKNIAEYLLYMWQVEDLLRACHFEVEKLSHDYLSRFRFTPGQLDEVAGWYGQLAEMMREEHLTEKGHLQINANIIIWLTDLHSRLLHSSKHPFYTAAYYKVLPYIVELRAKNKADADKPEIETCFDALYGLMLLHLQKKEVSGETELAMGEISKFVSMLAGYYRQDKDNTLEL